VSANDELARAKMVGAIAAVAVAIPGASVDPALLAWLAEMVVGALLKDPFAEARKARAAAQAEIVDGASAEASAAKRHAP
jgi:hypothetical protein